MKSMKILQLQEYFKGIRRFIEKFKNGTLQEKNKKI